MNRRITTLIAACLVVVTLAWSAACAADAPGSIVVASKPDTAAVFLDGEDAGVTPLTIQGVLPGKHTVVVKKEGYKTFTRSVTVKANRTAPLNAVLVKALPTKIPTKTPTKKPTVTTTQTPIVTVTQTAVPTLTPVVTGLTLSSTAFSNGETIPAEYGCAGAGSVIPVSWQGVPSGTKTLALFLEDPDAQGGTFVHWLLYNIPLYVTEVNGPVVPGANSGKNSRGGFGYYPPCPSSGTHHYIYRLYALDTVLEPESWDISVIRHAMKGHVLTTASLQGTYPE
jgi:Raf kinase inhibitor-like YbhB/YbcL family protein